MTAAIESTAHALVEPLPSLNRLVSRAQPPEKDRTQMMPHPRWITGLALAAGLALSAPAGATDVTEITTDDFYGAAYYETALEHPKVKKQKSEGRRIRLVARDMGWKQKKLAQAIEKVRSLDGEPTELAKTAMSAAFDKSRVKGHVLDVLFNTSEPKHVVCYVRWRGTSGREAVKEASTIANIVAQKAPFVSTLSLAAIHPKAPDDSKKSVWQAKIARTAMTRISPQRIEGYADRLYKRMFEEVKELPY